MSVNLSFISSVTTSPRGVGRRALPSLTTYSRSMDGGDGGGVGGGAADALLLQRPDQGGLGVAGGGLGEVLVPLGLFERSAASPSVRSGRGDVALLLLLVLALFIDGGEAGKFQAGSGWPGTDVARASMSMDTAVVDGVGHLAGQEAAPDQLVEPVLLRGQVSS